MANEFVEMGTTVDSNGALSGTINFDGYTCKDNREKVYMPQETSYLSTTLTLNYTL